jgi:hypothetical protein
MLALVGTARTSCAVRALLWRVLPAACPPLHRRILDARTRGLGGAVLHGCRCTCAAGPENNDADGMKIGVLGSWPRARPPRLPRRTAPSG